MCVTTSSKRQTFNVSFVCRESKVGKGSGLAPIEMSISINGSRTFVSLPRKEKPADFQRLTKSKKTNDLKQFLEAINARVQNVVTDLLTLGRTVTIEAVKQGYLSGIASGEYKVSDMFDDFFKVNKDRVGVSMCLSVWNKYHLVMDSFIGKVGDVDANTITDADIRMYYAHCNKVYKSSTAEGYLNKLKTVFKAALRNKKISGNPFADVKIKKVKVDVQFLTSEEIERIEKLVCTDYPRIERVKDLFLFQCYTGLAYADMMGLKKNDFTPCEKGYYLIKERVKTKVKYTVFLLPKAYAILEKYNWELPVLSNQKYNVSLKVLADWCKITKPLHSHIGRHTAATQFLNNGLGIDIVARILGHTNTQMTKHYAKLLDSSVVNAMQNLL